MAEPIPVPSAFNLLQFPQDVQISMLLAFDIRELVVCKRICRSLADLINGDISVRYKIELARSGKLDGTPSSAVTVSDRLTSLREHRARFRAGDHPLKHLRGRSFGSLGALSPSGYVTTVSGGAVHLWRPATTFSGIGEHKVTRTIRELRLEGFITGNCVADVVQDLLVFSRKEPNTMTIDCCIYSLSEGRPHPNASRGHISLSLVSEAWPMDWDLRDSIQVLGDLITWNLFNPYARRCQMRVINWKTGTTVWEFHHDFWSRSRSISEYHIVVVTSESLLVYPLDRDRKTPPAHSTTDTALCVLQLPAWSSISRSRNLYVQGHIQFPSRLRPEDQPLYRHDPSLTLLVLQVHYIVDVPDHDSELVHYAVFIPVSTIATHIRRVERTPQAPPRGPDRSDDSESSPAVRVVPWYEWGPAGTHVAHIGVGRICQFSPMGCSCAIAQRRWDAEGNAFLRVLVFDVHPWARPDADPEEERSGSLHLPEADTLSGLALTEAIRTTFPFDVTRRDISLGRDERSPTTVVLTGDGLLLVTPQA